MLKALAHSISPSICKLFINQSLTSGCFFRAWKMSNIVPIPKSSSNIGSPDNYRPISLLSVLSKVLEKHVHGLIHWASWKPPPPLPSWKIYSCCSLGYHRHRCLNWARKCVACFSFFESIWFCPASHPDDQTSRLMSTYSDGSELNLHPESHILHARCARLPHNYL